MTGRCDYTAGEAYPVDLGNGVVMTFHYIPSGEFVMGSRGRDHDEAPATKLCIPDGFWLAETPITQQQFSVWAAKKLPEHKNKFPGNPNHPAENLKWQEAMEFCAWLSKEMKAAGQFLEEVNLACLPTEAEWEYACRAGTQSDYHTGDGDAAMAETGWCSEEDWRDLKSTQPVGRKRANAWGLHDMHGNVDEWCHDVWGATVYRRMLPGESPTAIARRWSDFEGSWDALMDDGRLRVMRGGSWFDHAGNCRSAFRNRRLPGVGFLIGGFRVCLVRGPADAKALADRPAVEPKAEEKTLECGDLSPLSAAVDLSTAHLPHYRDSVVENKGGATSLPVKSGDKSPQSKALEASR